MTCYISASFSIAQQSPIPVYEDNTACIEWGNTILGGRDSERAKHIDIRKRFAHKVTQNGEMRLVRVPTSSQLADILTKGLHYQQWQACVEGILSKKVDSTEGTPVLKMGWIAKAYKSSRVAPEEGCLDITWEAKARARHRLESRLSESRDSDRDGVSSVVDGSGPMRKCRIVHCLSMGLFYVVCKVANSTAAAAMRQEVRQLCPLQAPALSGAPQARAGAASPATPAGPAGARARSSPA